MHTITPEMVKDRDIARDNLLALTEQTPNNYELKLLYRAFIDAVGPKALGVLWAADGKEVNKMAWRVSSSTMLAMLRGLMAMLPAPQHQSKETH